MILKVPKELYEPEKKVISGLKEHKPEQLITQLHQNWIGY